MTQDDIEADKLCHQLSVGVLRQGQGDTARVRYGGQAMMRLRRASVIVTLSLLTSAATVHAEYAWVMGGKIAGDPVMGWFIRGTLDRREECTRAYGVYLNDMRRLGWQVVGDMNGATGQGALITSPLNPQYKETVVCRPDSVPPTKGGVMGS